MTPTPNDVAGLGKGGLRPPLRTAVIIDYSNLLHTAFEHYVRPIDPDNEPYHAFFDPSRMADEMVRVRNRARSAYIEGDPGPIAQVTHIEVHRGLSPDYLSPISHAVGMEQARRWEADERLTVHHRLLRCLRRSDGSILKVSEKGVDTAAALGAYKAALRPDIDLVIIASGDSDLYPAAEAILETDTGVELTGWAIETAATQPRTEDGRRVWRTFVPEHIYWKAHDPTDYGVELGLVEPEAA